MPAQLAIRMTTPPKRKTVTFIVRIWAEYLCEQPPRWFGEIESIENGEKSHFKELTQVIEIIQQKTQSPLSNLIEMKRK
jgi:hypothetical protein